MILLKESEGVRLVVKAPLSADGYAYRIWLLAILTLSSKDFLEANLDGQSVFISKIKFKSETEASNFYLKLTSKILFDWFEPESYGEYFGDFCFYIPEDQFTLAKKVSPGSYWKILAKDQLSGFRYWKDDPYSRQGIEEIFALCQEKGKIKNVSVDKLLYGLQPLGLCPDYSLSESFSGERDPELNKNFCLSTFVDDVEAGPHVPWSNSDFFAAMAKCDSLKIAESIIKNQFKFVFASGW